MKINENKHNIPNKRKPSKIDGGVYNISSKTQETS